MLSFMELFLRVIFCTPPTEGIDNTDVTRQQRALSRLALLFDVLDLGDSILDVVEGIRLLTTSNKIQGILLLSGIALARAIASKGKYVLLNGGLLWVPFFQDASDFTSKLTIEREKTMRSLFAIIFTEIAIFLFEDATLLYIWVFSKTFDRSDWFDVLNAWATLLSIAMSSAVLLLTLVVSLSNWTWKSGCCAKIGQILGALLFCGIFALVFFFLVLTLFYGFRTVAREDKGDSMFGLVLAVCCSWIFATYFSCRLRMEARFPRPLMATEAANGGGPADRTTTNSPALVDGSTTTVRADTELARDTSTISVLDIPFAVATVIPDEDDLPMEQSFEVIRSHIVVVNQLQSMAS